MQCPNCHKDAINVNGKYVCLDCGIEISPEEQVQDLSLANNNYSAAIENHDIAVQPAPVAATVDPLTSVDNNPVQVADITAAPMPSEPAVSIQPPQPLSQISPETDGGNLIPQPAVSSDSLEQTASIGSTDSNIGMATPVRDEIVKELNSEVATNIGDQQNNVIPPVASVIPDFPDQPQGNNLTPVSAVDVGSVAPAETPPIPQPAVDYFQPSTVDISVGNNPEPTPPLTTEQNLTQTVQANPIDSVNTPDLSLSSTPVQPSVPQGDFSNNGIQNNLPGPTENLDSMLGGQPLVSNNNEAVQDIFGDNPVATAPVVDAVQQPSIQATPLEAQPQQSNAMPSYESVFGATNGQVSSPNPANQPGAKKKLNKKSLIIIGSVVLGMILLGGVILAVLNSNSGGGDDTTTQGDELTISNSVETAMDGELNLTVSYNQKINFSGLKLSEKAGTDEGTQKVLSSVVEKNATNEGKWQLNNAGNVKLEAKVNGTEEKKIKLEEEGVGFDFNPAVASWEEKEDLSIESVPDFYDLDTKAKLFYVANSEVKASGQESLDGTSYNKYQIIPNPEFLAGIIKASHDSLSDLDLTVTDSSGLLVYVLLDSDNKIVKVTATGKILLSSETFSEGSYVTIESEGNYEYQDQAIEITKPEDLKSAAAVSETKPVINDQANTSEDDDEASSDVEVDSTVVKVSGENIEESKNSGGKG